MDPLPEPETGLTDKDLTNNDLEDINQIKRYLKDKVPVKLVIPYEIEQ